MKKKATRARRITVRFTPDEYETVIARAGAHQVAAAEFMRRAALAGNSGHASAADTWWDQHSPHQKYGLYSWLGGRRRDKTVTAKGPALFDA